MRDGIWIRWIDLDAVGEHWLWQPFRRYSCFEMFVCRCPRIEDPLTSEMAFDDVMRARQGKIVHVAGRTASAGAHGTAVYGACHHANHCVIMTCAARMIGHGSLL